MRHLIFAAILLVAGCDQPKRQQALKSSAPGSIPQAGATSAPLTTPQAVITPDPSVYILKCEGKGSSAATLPSGEGFSDPDDEELYVRVDVGAKALQTWI